MSFCFWAWPCIPFFRYTGIDGAALLPQGRFKLLLVRNRSLPYTPFSRGVRRKAHRGKLPRTVRRGWLYPQPRDSSGAPRSGSLPPRTPGPRATPARAAGAARPPTGLGGRRVWARCSQQNCASGSCTWRHPGKDSELTHGRSLLPEG